MDKTMICEKCGVEMNHHADKVDYNAGLDDSNEIDAVYGGIVEEAHTCPHCGRTQVRPIVNSTL